LTRINPAASRASRIGVVTREEKSMKSRDEYVSKLKKDLDRWNVEAAKWQAQARADESWERMREAVRAAQAHFEKEPAKK
jgi:hypothetical protein